MSNPNVSTWFITKVQARDWLQDGSVASVWASNWANDSIAFDMSWHPDGFSVIYNIEINFHSEDLLTYQGEDIINDSILDEAESKLEDWWDSIVKARAWLRPKNWQVARGLPAPQGLYAALAYLYTQRAEMNPLLVTKLLSADMSVPESTTKERIRKAREKGFLTSPGKGLNGQGEVTQSAKRLLRKEGLEL
jgi:hypothetical protein